MTTPPQQIPPAARSSSPPADTIAAVATPPGRGGIGVIRISGPNAKSILKQIFRFPVQIKKDRASETTGELVPRRLHYGHLHRPGKTDPLDEVLAVYMPPPATYTREPVVEIQSHSGRAVMNAILDAVLSAGCRLADPGEFTRRAYMNGRIDLTQAEAVIDTVNAESELARKRAATQLSGYLNREIKTLNSELLEIVAALEADIDFPEETEGEVSDIPGALQKQVIRPLKKILSGAELFPKLTEGINIVISGRPNVGKSTLFNRLTGAESAIVTPYPGTTRDVLTAHLNFRGQTIRLLDTAGLHETADPIETIGVDRAKLAAESADVLIYMIDAVNGPTKEDRSMLSNRNGTPTLVVANKADQLTEPPEEIPGDDLQPILISALRGDGIDNLQQELETICINGFTDETLHLTPNLRQAECLRRALDAATEALSLLQTGAPPEIVSIELQEALRSVSHVTGDSVDPDVLAEIFQTFCIGK